MRFPCTIAGNATDGWTVRHIADDGTTLETAAPTRDEALEKMRGELRYRLELCPCSGESYQHIAIDIVAELDRDWR